MRLLSRLLIITFLCANCLIPAAVYGAAVRDDFSATRRMQSAYFTILCEDGVRMADLEARVYLPPAIRAIITDPASSDSSDHIIRQMDLFFLAVSKIMDMRLKDFSCTIKICRSAERLRDVSRRLFGQDMRVAGFYVAPLNTLYISAETITPNILAHELAHAVLTQYFVVPPPEKMQEVLAGYVEYEFRKYTNTVPK